MKSLMISFIVILITAGSSIAQEFNAQEKKILKAVVDRFKTNTECSATYSDTPIHEFIRFKKKTEYDSDTIVILIACSFHAYQVTWIAYSAYDDGAEPEVSVLSFPSTIDGKEWTASIFLMTPDWDPKTKTLNTFYKGRGMADCGDYKSYRWNGYSFYLYSSNYQACCWNDEDFEKRAECKKVKEIYPIPDYEWPRVFQYTGKQ